MKPLRKTLLVTMPLLGIALCAGAHLAPAGTLLSFIGAKVSFLLILATVVLALLPERAAPSASDAAEKPVSRTLSDDTLNDSTLSLTLPERIEHAIELSKLQSRTFGVLSIRVGDYDSLVRRVGAEKAMQAVTKAAAALHKQLRATDRAAVHGAGEILVCLPLINVKRDLETIAARLSRKVAVVVAAQVDPGVEPPVDTGISMYPLGGYGGEELIATAQDGAEAARSARLGRPVAVRADRGPPPVLPPRKPARKLTRAASRPRRMAGAQR